jgi:hypothetical protein
MSSDHLHKMQSKGRAEKWQCSNLQKRKEAVSVILFHDIPHSVPRIQLAQVCQKFLPDPIFLSKPDVFQLNVSRSGFTHFRQILDGVE